ncbi:hypothetical protein I6U48_00710 [Clostridium sp. PL3]|uniref:Uncharacterized protein n=1 Tax=Clostridium thailandense TaxID=2794346 RepID=A0A949TT73_9CLOT|nr:hypothetical protein [Clostridium thailandense]MBV7271441.1 hypothetical protein [Clostridium thailandense]
MLKTKLVSLYLVLFSSTLTLAVLLGMSNFYVISLRVINEEEYMVFKIPNSTKNM